MDETAPAPPMPDGLVVREIPPPPPSSEHARSEPFRSPPRAPLKPGLEIGWTSGSEGIRFLALALVKLFIVLGVLAAVIWATRSLWVVSAMVLGAVAGSLFLYRHGSDRPMFVRADASGLSWVTRGSSSFYRRQSLAAANVRQLYVRRKRGQQFGVYARDGQNRDHLIWSFASVEQAVWIEARIEAHLGIVNIRVKRHDEVDDRTPKALRAGDNGDDWHPLFGWDVKTSATPPSLDIGWSEGSIKSCLLSAGFFALSSFALVFTIYDDLEQPRGGTVGGLVLFGPIVVVSAGVFVRALRRAIWLCADHARLHWRRGLSWFSWSRTLTVGEVRQFFLRQRMSGAYSLNVRDSRGRDHRVWSFDSLDEAQWVQKRLTTVLGSGDVGAHAVDAEHALDA